MLDDFRKTTIQEHFRIISHQNEKIAQGILSVAQMLQSNQPQVQQPVDPMTGQQVPPGSPVPNTVNPSAGNQNPGMMPPPPGVGLPPPPPRR